MKRTLIATAMITAFASAPVWAAPDVRETRHATMALQLAQAGTPPAGQPQPMGPGMMRGQGMGPGMMGQGYGPGMMGQGYGPGMMGQGMGPGMMGQGMGPGMMGYGMGPGMMGQGYGPGMMGQGYGPGMMGQGMGPGMMGYGMGGMMGQGMGPGMMGPGMMGGANPYAALDLSDAQRAKVAEIQEQLWRKHWDLMGKMHEERYHMHRFMSGAAADDAGARKAYAAMADAHKQMFDATLEARKQVEAVLTPEQRDKLKRGG